MRRATIIVVSMAFGAALAAWATASHYAAELERERARPRPVQHAQVTDDQLLAFWFGNSADPARLRERACGRKPRR